MDDNDRLRAGTLPEDPAEGATPMHDPNASQRRPFTELAVWGGDLVDMDPPPRRALLSLSEPIRSGGEVLVRPEDIWLPDGWLCLLASPGGRGKSAVLMSLAAHVAAGVPWCGLHVVRPGAVALVCGEEDRDECHRRMLAAMKHMKDEDRRRGAARMLLLPLAGTGENRLVDEGKPGTPARPSDRAAELRTFLAAASERVGGWSLVVVDPFARVAGLTAETDNASATETMTVLEGLTKLPGEPAVLVAHHSRKGDGKSEDPDDLADLVRGSSAIRDAARWVGYLLRVKSDPERGLELRVVKSNYTRRDKALALSTEHGTVTRGDVVDAWLKPAASSPVAPKGKTAKTAAADVED